MMLLTERIDVFSLQTSPFIIIGIAFLSISLLNLKIPEKIGIIFSQLSKTAFGIFFIHFVFIYLCSLIKVNEVPLFAIGHNYITIPVFAAVCFIFSFFVIYIIRKIPFLKNVV